MNRLLPSVALAATFLIAGVSCKKKDFSDDRLKLKNNTSKTIAAYYDYNYPDVSLQATRPSMIDARNMKALPGAEMTLSRETNWETCFADKIPSGKLSIFIFDNAVLSSQPWDSVRNNVMIYKRIDITIDSLKKVDYKLSVN